MTRIEVRRICFAGTLVLALSAVASAQDRRTCSNASLTGTWGYTENGTVVTPAGAVIAAAVGKYTFDEAGNFSGTQHSSAGGVVNADTKVGTYTVNPDCSGTLMLSIYDQAGTLIRNSVWDFVLVDNARELRGIMTSMTLPNGTPLAPIMTSSAKRVFPRDDNDQDHD